MISTALCVLFSACGGKRKRYFENMARLVEMNDLVDSRVAKLPRTNAFKYPDYLPKLDGCISQKETIRGEMQIMEPPFLVSPTHEKMLVAMNNGIRYLKSEREKFMIAAEQMEKTAPRTHRGRDEFEIIREYQSQAASYQANMKEQLMKQQYERLYWDAKDELERAEKF